MLHQGSHSDWKNGKAFFQSGKSQGILNRLEKSRKIRQNTGKLKKFETKVIYIILVIFTSTVYYFLKWIKFSVKKTRTLKKYWKNGK